MKSTWFAFVVICVFCGVNLYAAQTLVALDGRTISAEIASINQNGGIQLEGRDHADFGERDRAVALQSIREIDRDVVRVVPLLSAQRLYLVDGSVLVANHVTMRGGMITFNWLGGEAAKMPVEQARGILLAPLSARGRGRATPEEPFVQAVSDQRAGRDQLLVIREGGLTEVPGALQSLDDKQAMFVWNGRARRIDRHKLYGITLAAMTLPEDLTGLVCVQLIDGSTVWGKLVRLSQGELVLRRPPPEGTMTLPWRQVMRVRVRSDRMTFVSDMPVSEQQTRATVTYAWSMRTDTSVMGGPLTIGNHVYERGLGVHARSRLVYNIGGRYRTFATVIGLDAAAGGSGEGDCVFVVKGDGKLMLEQRMKEGEQGKAIRLDVTGVKRLELTVEEGRNLDIGDWADWADARLIK